MNFHLLHTQVKEKADADIPKENLATNILPLELIKLHQNNLEQKIDTESHAVVKLTRKYNRWTRRTKVHCHFLKSVNFVIFVHIAFVLVSENNVEVTKQTLFTIYFKNSNWIC